MAQLEQDDLAQRQVQSEGPPAGEARKNPSQTAQHGLPPPVRLGAGVALLGLLPPLWARQKEHPAPFLVLQVLVDWARYLEPPGLQELQNRSLHHQP